MMKSKITTLLFGAMVLFGLSSNLMASDAKCGAGKCGDAKKEMPASKCGGDKVAPAAKCGDTKKEAPASKCGAGKCGDAKKEMPTSKCGGDKK